MLYPARQPSLDASRQAIRTPLALVGGLILGCWAAACGESAQSGPAPSGPPPVAVELTTLTPQPVEQVGKFVGTIRSRRSTTVQPQAEGFVTAILVTAGARVRKGAPLFEIDASTQQAAVASLEAQLASREADAVYARQQAERAATLLDVGAVSQQEYEQAVTQRRTTEAQLRSVEDQIRQQRAELAYYQVVAQAAGVVGDIPVRVGDRVTRATVLTTIDSNTGLEVYISVPVQQAPQLRLGLPVRIVDDAGEPLVTSALTFIASSVDDTTQTVLVKAPVDGAGDQLRAAQYVRAEVVWSTEPALLLPVIAVQRVNNQYFAFVAEETESGLVARQRPVEVGPVTANAYVVRSGLAAGARLILAGAQKIGDGVAVQPLPSHPPGESGTVLENR